MNQDAKAARPKPPNRTDFSDFHTLPTRWADNDVYGHINNVAYYGFFDTAVNAYLIEQCGLDIHRGPVIGLVVETGCHYYSPAAFPDVLDIGLGVERMGHSSVVYRLGVFLADKPDIPGIALGRFVHVYVDRDTQRPVSLPEQIRAGLTALL